MEKTIFKLSHTVNNIRLIIELDKNAGFVFLEEEFSNLLSIGLKLLSSIKVIDKQTIESYFRLYDRIKSLRNTLRNNKEFLFEHANDKNNISRSIELFKDSLNSKYEISFDEQLQTKDDEREMPDFYGNKIIGLEEDIYFFNNQSVMSYQNFVEAGREETFFTLCDIHEQISTLFKRSNVLFETLSNGTVKNETLSAIKELYTRFAFCMTILKRAINLTDFSNCEILIKLLKDHLYHLDLAVTLTLADFYIETSNPKTLNLTQK